MINIHILKEYPYAFERLFFISSNDFNLLITRIEPIWRKSELERRKKTNKKHKLITTGSGRLPKCSLEQRVSMFLLYHHNHISHKFLGKLFCVDESRVSQYFRYLRPIIVEYRNSIPHKSNMSEEEIRDIIDEINKEHI